MEVRDMILFDDFDPGLDFERPNCESRWLV